MNPEEFSFWRSNLKFLLTVILLFSIYVSSNAFADIHVTSGTISVVDSVMYLKGDITPKLAKEFRLAFTPQIKTIVVSSHGGHTRASLEMAELMLNQDLILVVEDKCNSACANLFLAAERKIIRPGAYVGWHGGAVNALASILYDLRQALEGKVDKLAALRLAQLLKSEVDFYQRVGVDLDFVHYSGMVSPSIQSNQTKPKNYLIDGKLVVTTRTMPRDYELWVPDVKQMEVFGIQNVAPFSYPKEKQAIKKYFGGMNVYLGKAYTYFYHRQLRTKKSLRFDWDKYQELQLELDRLMAKIQEQSEEAIANPSKDLSENEK